MKYIQELNIKFEEKNSKFKYIHPAIVKNLANNN